MNTLPAAGEALARLLGTTGSVGARRRVRHDSAVGRRINPFGLHDQLPPLAGGWRDRTKPATAIPVPSSAFQSPVSSEPAANPETRTIPVDLLTTGTETVESKIRLTAEALGGWDRRESPTDVHSRQEQLLRALVLVGHVSELLRNDRTWIAVTTRSRADGGRLADATAAYEWALCAPGGLRAAARLCGSPVLFAVWCDEPWWLTPGDLDPLYRRSLAGQPVATFVREILAAADETLSLKGQLVGSSASC